jgi:predicted transcriptional regulator
MARRDVGLQTLLDLSEQVIDQEASASWATTMPTRSGSVVVVPEGSEVKMKVVRIGIAPQARIRARMLAIARGQLKPKASDPKIWFTSMRSLSQVLSDENRALLEVIRTAKPDSISELADLTGRKQGNLSRTLKTMSRYGLVKLVRVDRQVRPVAEAERYQIVA